MASQTDNFPALLKSVQAWLASEQRVSYRGLKRQFQLGDDEVEDLKHELIYTKKLAADEDGKVLVWLGAEARVSRRNYTPPHLAEKILSQRFVLEGEKKRVTVLFCDVRNSMGLAEKLGIEAWHRTMNEFFALITSRIHRLEGTINQYTGDGVMALFGAPLATEDHALRACLAALDIARNRGALNARVLNEFGLPFEVRIGLNTGDVIVGSIGDDLRMDYTAQGQVVGIAARLESLAGPDQVLMTEFTAAEVKALVELESLGTREIKGASRPLEVFRLDAVRERANRFDSARKHGLSVLVGRTRELLLLDSALDAALVGHGGGLGIVAEAGVGKSRLGFEFVQRARARGCQVWQGNAVAHGKHLPLLPIQQVFRDFFGVVEHAPAVQARELVRSRLVALKLELEVSYPLLCEFLDAADPAATPLQIDPDARQRHLLALLQQLLHLGSQTEAGTVVILEDLHWLDEASTQFLQHWIDTLGGSRILLLTSSRPDGQPNWLRRDEFRKITLAPLNEADVAELVGHLLGKHPSIAALAAAIYQRSGGNPFFCEEIVELLRGQGYLTQQFALQRPLDGLAIPSSVKSVLATRIDRLHENHKALLQAAAVIGREFDYRLLPLVADLAEPELTHALDALIEARFVDDTGRVDARAYRFKHALTQDVAMDTLLSESRGRLHARVAAAMETVHADSPGEIAAIVAYHWESAGQPLPAAVAVARAAAHIGPRNRKQEMEHHRKILRLTDPLPLSMDRHKLRLQALAGVIAGGAWRFTMSGEELEALSREAITLAEGAGLVDLAALLRSGAAASLGMMQGNIPNWGAAIDRMMAETSNLAEETHAALLGNHTYSLYVRGDFALGLAQAQRAWQMADGRVEYGLASGYSVLALCKQLGTLHAAALGQLDYALALNAEVLETAITHKLTEERIWIHSNRSEVVSLMGYPPSHPAVQDAVAHAITGLELAEQFASDFTRGVARRARTISLLMQQDFAAASSMAEDCLAHCRARRAHLEVEARCLVLLADAQCGLGEAVAARVTAEAAITRAREQGAPYFEAMGELAKARAALQLEAHTDAAHALERAYLLAEQTQGRALLPQILETRARLHAHAGDIPAVNADWASALAGYRAVQAHGHAERLANGSATPLAI